MPSFNVHTVAGMFAFKLPAAPSDTVAHLNVRAGKLARVHRLTWKNMKLVHNKEVEVVRLSLGRTFLRPTDSVAGLGLRDGARLMLHVKATPLVRSSAPLPVFSFGREAYDIWVNICSPSGRSLFRLKLSPTMDAKKAVEAAVGRAKISGFGDAQDAELRFRGMPLKPGRPLSVYRINTGDEVDLHGLGDDEEEPPPTPRSPLSRTASHSHNVLASPGRGAPHFDFVMEERRRASRYGPPSSRPGSAPAKWLPVGPNEIFG